MKPSIQHLTAILALAFLASVSNAHEAQTPVSRLMEESGLNAQIAEIPVALDDAQKKMGLKKEIYDAAKGSFNAVKMTRGVKEKIEKSLSADEVKAVLEWLDSPTGKKITEMEKAASSVKSMEEIKPFAAELEKGGPRVELVKRLNSAILGTDVALDMARNITVSMTASLNPSKDLDMKMIQEQIRNSISAMKPMIEQQVLSTILYTYRNLSDKELTRYIGFAETKDARHYHQVACSAINDEMTAASSSIGESIGKSIKSQKTDGEASR